MYARSVTLHLFPTSAERSSDIALSSHSGGLWSGVLSYQYEDTWQHTQR